MATQKYTAIILLCVFLYACGSGGGSSEAAPAQIAVQTEPTDCDWTIHGEAVASPSRVFIFAGQSNMKGFGYRPKLIAQTPANVSVWDNGWKKYTVTKCFGPELEFLMRWSSDHPGESIGFIKLAHGDTSMSEWRHDYQPSESRYPKLGSLFLNLLDLWQDSGSLPVEGVIWVQGETDANSASLAPNYESRINNFITQLHYNIGNVPFVFSETQWLEAIRIPIIHAAQAKLETSKIACMVKTGDISTYPTPKTEDISNNIHFDTEGQLTIGRRLYDRWTQC